MSDLPCRNCEGYTKCVLCHPVISDREEWWHFGEIKWCPFQCLWLLANKALLWSGQWPPEFREVEGSRQVSTEGNFVRPTVVIAELMARLDRTGVQGEMLMSQVEDGRSFHTLSSGAKEALMYVKGFRRKHIGCRRWVREVYYGQKVKEGTA